ncbi:tetratricopeptide repeat protein [Photobacterium sp. TY1-4]|uniref:tetratricopeptide repeat protein n=1 Tax=Photobacterium sp. TY1-4 TaxID=2899122 RepID=UPI0021C1A466|nr:tetratricopeptide repeat protein [Photobacterium sp. TY1-4]UXI03715.1 sel1 repeat family protein [Photobacterium sp. TY1-4]
MKLNRKTLNISVFILLLSALFYVNHTVAMKDDVEILSLPLEADDVKVRTQAINQLKILADQGNPIAQYRYAEILLRNRDTNDAIFYLKSASDAGELISTELLGMTYIDLGGSGNVQKGFQLLNHAAVEGLSTSQLYLGMCFLDGECSIPKHDYLAFYWLSQALKNGEYSAKLFLEKLPKYKLDVALAREESQKVACQIDRRC